MKTLEKGGAMSGLLEEGTPQVRGGISGEMLEG